MTFTQSVDKENRNGDQDTNDDRRCEKDGDVAHVRPSVVAFERQWVTVPSMLGLRARLGGFYRVDCPRLGVELDAVTPPKEVVLHDDVRGTGRDTDGPGL